MGMSLEGMCRFKWSSEVAGFSRLAVLRRAPKSNLTDGEEETLGESLNGIITFVSDVFCPDLPWNITDSPKYDELKGHLVGKLRGNTPTEPTGKPKRRLHQLPTSTSPCPPNTCITLRERKHKST